MPKVMGPDGNKKEISMEEFAEIFKNGGSGSLERIHVNADGEEVRRVEIPRENDGSFNPFYGLLEEKALYAENLLREAEEGKTESMERLAIFYLNGEKGFEQQPEKSAYWFNKLAEAGNSNAQFNLGLFFAKGFGVERDYKAAAYWMSRAAENGDEDALSAAAAFRKYAVDYEGAINGDAKAQTEYAADLMSIGNSLEQATPDKDYKESIKWAEKAAAQGEPKSYWVLGLAYEHGRGVASDKSRAATYYRRGAEHGSAECMHNLGSFYMRGAGVKRDEKRGFELFRNAAEQNYGLAMRDLAACYQFGNGVDVHMDSAIYWYKKASEKLNDEGIKEKVSKLKGLKEYLGADHFDNLHLKNERLAQHLEEMNNSPYEYSRVYMYLHGKSDPELQEAARKWSMNHTEGIAFGYLDSYLEICHMQGINMDLSLDTVKNIMPGLSALFKLQKESYDNEKNLDIILKTLAAVLSYTAINEHGFWFKSEPASVIYSASKAIGENRKSPIFSITNGKKVLTNFYPCCKKAAARSVLAANGYSIMIDGIVEEYKKLTGVNLCEYGLANLFVN